MFIPTSSYGADIRGLRLSTISVLTSSGYLHRHRYTKAKFLPSAIFICTIVVDWMGITVDACGSPITHRRCAAIGSRAGDGCTLKKAARIFRKPKPPTFAHNGKGCDLGVGVALEVP